MYIKKQVRTFLLLYTIFKMCGIIYNNIRKFNDLKFKKGNGDYTMKTKGELPACPVATAVALIGGKWKLLILRNLKARPWRFNELQRDLEGISQKVLTDSLRQMIDDGLAYRTDYHEMPPKVEYGLTELGREMLPIIDALADFGNYYKSVLNSKHL